MSNLFAVILFVSSALVATTLATSCKNDGPCLTGGTVQKTCPENDTTGLGFSSLPLCVNGTCACVGVDCLTNCTQQNCLASCKGYDDCQRACMPKGTVVSKTKCPVPPAPIDRNACAAVNCTGAGVYVTCIGGACACAPVQCTAKCTGNCNCVPGCATKCVQKNI